MYSVSGTVSFCAIGFFLSEWTFAFFFFLFLHLVGGEVHFSALEVKLFENVSEVHQNTFRIPPGLRWLRGRWAGLTRMLVDMIGRLVLSIRAVLIWIGWSQED